MRILDDLPDDPFLRIVGRCDKATTEMAGAVLRSGQHVGVDAESLAPIFRKEVVLGCWHDVTAPRKMRVGLLKGASFVDAVEAAGGATVSASVGYAGVFAGEEQAYLLCALFGDGGVGPGAQFAAAAARRARRNAKRAGRH